MAHADFIHLRVHTAYSLSEGALPIGKLAEICGRHRMPAVAITDTNNLFGALEFSTAMAGAGVQPIIGCQLTVATRDAVAARNGPRNGRRPPEPEPLVVLAQDEAGYGNLLALSSKAYLETAAGETPRVALDDLAARNTGLICLTGGPDGPIGRLMQDGQNSAAEALLQRLSAIFPGRLYVELQRHNLAAEQRQEPALLALAYAHDLPLVATNECFFADAEMYEAHDALICVASGCYVGEADRRRLTVEHRFKSAEEMRILFADLPEAIDNTIVVARRCAYRSPVREPILPRFATAAGLSEADAFRDQGRHGLEARLESEVYSAEMDATAREEAARSYRERLEFELDVIVDMDFSGYFLIVADFIQWAKSAGIPVGPGRGSGAGSVVAWALTITDLDPLRFGLLFERFLNPDRVSMPDFDIDFCQDRRDEVIRYVREKYGDDHVAQIITFGKLQARAALRDVGRVLQLPFKQVDRICKLVPNNPAKPVTLAQAIEDVPRLKAERDDDPAVAHMMSIALKLEGLYRHASTHAAGLVIGDRPLEQLVPLYRDPRSEMRVTQFSMKYAEQSGLVKTDFLGLKTLTVIDRATRLLAARDIAVDIARIPLDDEKTYQMLQQGEAVGVFQFEGSGMRDLLRDASPSNIEDLIALVALFRPGPMQNIPKYVAAKHGREQPEFLHETIEPVVRDTYGVIIYQEQVMQIAQVFAGFTLGQADLLRRAMGKKIQSEMDAQRDDFVEGAVARGVDRGRAAYVFELVDRFAGYGFNKAHSAGYALLAYQTAWLKANYPFEFLAAAMTLDFGNTDKLNVFRQELARLGVELRPPDVNRSGVEFTVEADESGAPSAIRYALAAVKNVGRQAMRALVAERTENGAFQDLFDLARRLDPSALNKRQMESLARAGAFDGLNRNRHQVYRSVELLLAHASAAADERGSGQASLFDDGDGGVANPALPDVDPWPATERLTQEFDAIGFYLSAHPLDVYAKSLARKGVRRAAEVLADLNDSARSVKIAGTVIGRRELRSSRGGTLAFVQASDPSGMFEVTVFSELLATHGEMLEVGKSVVFTVEARADGDRARLAVQKIDDADTFVADAAGGVRIFLGDPVPLESVRTVLQKTGKGGGMVFLVLRLPDRGEEVEVEVPSKYAITPTVRQSLKGVRGVIDVHEI